MDAREVKDRLYARHPGHGGQMPGPWTVIEEYRCIDVLAFSAWSSAKKYARIGYEVKVSRSDLRNELLRPDKRAGNVAWCNEFYFAVPSGLLTPEELAYVEPEWAPEDFVGERCPGFLGERCQPMFRRRRYSRSHYVDVPNPSTTSGWWDRTRRILCPTCGGKGSTTKPRVVREAPTCWVPRDVGLVVVGGNGSRVVKPSPKRATVAPIEQIELGVLIRWVSMRPDQRHHPKRDAFVLEATA